jgi:anaerobic dimethyl sulfoxide reductase subunit B
MTYAFIFDARACSGCKACQEACKDRNKLPLGVLWRQVVEVSGGKWQKTGAAWENSVFAYNLSLACNHCAHPKCAGVCPTDAYSVRPDGIVLLDSSKCMGCGYCAWACPYGAPQYNPGQGVMTKCNFCYDSLDAGQPPSCVAACPLRVLDFGTVEALNAVQANRNLWQLPAVEHPFPLPNASRTEPHLAIRPHAGMSTTLAKTVANREELRPSGMPEHTHKLAAVEELPGSEELPLVAFTLLAQMAAGMAVGALALASIPWAVLLAIGALLGAGGLISFLHLGRKRNAWRAVIHLRKSWLSREVLAAGLFGAAWALVVGLAWLHQASFAPWLMALLGVGLVYCMGRVYRLRPVPAWDSWRTPAAFFLSTILLGALGIRLAVAGSGWAIIAGLALAVETAMALADRSSMRGRAGRLRVILLGLGMVGTLAMAITPQGNGLAVPVFLIALAAEIVGRWQFYASRAPGHF